MFGSFAKVADVMATAAFGEDTLHAESQAALQQLLQYLQHHPDALTAACQQLSEEHQAAMTQLLQ